MATKNWDDTLRYMIGTEWNVTPNWDLRLSYAFDETPVPDETIAYELPDSNRHMFSFGFGYHRDKWSLDFSYTYILFENRDINQRTSDGILQGQVTDGYAQLFGLSLGYKF